VASALTLPLGGTARNVVRAFIASGQVTEPTTFTAEERRAEVDAWLYETCTQCLQHMVDIVAAFYAPVAPILPRILDLLTNFVRCARMRAPAACTCLHLLLLLASTPVLRACCPACIRSTGLGDEHRRCSSVLTDDLAFCELKRCLRSVACTCYTALT
jgi:hypothetical protein